MSRVLGLDIRVFRSAAVVNFWCKSEHFGTLNRHAGG